VRRGSGKRKQLRRKLRLVNLKERRVRRGEKRDERRGGGEVIEAFKKKVRRGRDLEEEGVI